MIVLFTTGTSVYIYIYIYHNITPEELKLVEKESDSLSCEITSSTSLTSIKAQQHNNTTTHAAQQHMEIPYLQTCSDPTEE